MNSSNFSKFADNFSIIKRLYEDENKDIDFIARWLRMSKANLQLCINRYFKRVDRLEELNQKHMIKQQRITKVKASIFEFLNSNKGRCVAI